MSIFEEYLKEGKYTDKEIRNAILIANDEILSSYADEGKYSSEEVLSAISQAAGMPNVIGGFDDTKTEEQIKTDKSLSNMFAGVDISNNKYLTVDALSDKQNTIQPSDTTTTMPIQEVQKSFEQGQKNKAALDSYIAGAKTLPIGMNVLIQDFSNWVQDKADDDFTKEDYADWATQWAKENKEKLNKANENAGFSENDFFTPDLFGQVTAELLTLPFTVLKAIKGIKWLKDMKLTTQAAIGEGALATTTSLGEGSDYGDAFISGLQSAALTKVGGEAIDYLGQVIKGNTNLWSNLVEGKAGTKEVYEFVIEKSGATPDDLAEFNNKYSKAIKKPVEEFTEEDKVLALINNSDVASKFKMEAEYYGESVLSKQANLEESMRRMIKRQTASGDFEWAAVELDEFINKSGEMYGEVKNILLDNFNVNVKIDGKSLSGLKKVIEDSSMTSDQQVIVKRILKKLDEASVDGLPVEELLDMRKNINSLNLKSTKAFKAGQVGDFIDNAIRKGIGDDGFALWKDVNKRYAAKFIMEEENPIGKLLRERVASNGNISEVELADAIINMKGKGYKTFNALRQADLLGEKTVSNIEKKIVDTVISNGKNLSESLENIKSFEFATKEGRQLQSELDRISGMIPKEDAKNIIARFFGKDGSSVGWSDNIINKMKYGIVGKVYDSIIRRMPSGSGERAFLKLGEILKEQKIQQIDLDIKKDKIFQQAFIDEQANLKQRIQDLKDMGNKRTSIENKELAETIQVDNQISDVMKRLGVQKTGTSKPRKPAKVVEVKEVEQPKEKPLGVNPDAKSSVVRSPNKPIKMSSEPKDKQQASEYSNKAMFGMEYGKKATTKNTKATSENKEYLKKFLDDVANPKVNVDTSKVNDLFSALKSDGTTMYGATVAKEKAWNKAMESVSRMKNKKSATPKDRDEMIDAVKKYYDLLDDTI